MPRGKRNAAPIVEDGPEKLVLSVRLKSGRFETTLEIPFPCDKETYEKSLTAWFDMAATGFRIGASEMSAVFPDHRETSDAT